MDTMGDKIGRIHLGRQNIDELQARKMKGLKRTAADLNDGTDDDDDEQSVGHQVIGESATAGPGAKKPRST
jgi:hypothetical protein